MSAAPEVILSVALMAPDGFGDIRRTMEHIRAQTVRDRLEIVIVTPAVAGLEMDPAIAQGFGAMQVLEGDPVNADGEARARAVRHARADIIAFTEEHAFPEPGWAEALVEAHRGPWAAVGSGIVNANPASPISWANLFLDFGHSVAPGPAREAEHLAGHNTSYKRAVLLDYGSRLADMLSPEENLFRDLRARGHRLYLEPSAQVRHVNISAPVSFLRAEYLGGRIYGATRSRLENWSRARQLFHTIGGPLFALARLRHVLRDVARTGHQREVLPRALPALVAGLLFHGTGEAVGSTFGAGQAYRQRSTHELHRLRHVQARDRETEAAE